MLNQIKKSSKKGHGAIAFKGKLLDIVTIKQAKNIVELRNKIIDKKMIKFFLDFENEIAEIEARINDLRHLSTGKTVKYLDEITELEFKANKILKEKYC